MGTRCKSLHGALPPLVRWGRPSAQPGNGCDPGECGVHPVDDAQCSPAFPRDLRHAVYGHRAIAPAIASTALALLWAAPEGYWVSRPAYLAYALALTVLLPLVVASLVAAMRDIALRAIASREAQGRFVSTMSHELRTPLNAIISGIQLLEVGTVSVAQRHALATVATQAQALRHRIDDVLDVASIDGGRLQLRLHSCSLRSIMEGVQATCMPAAADKGVLLQLDGSEPDVWMLADGGRIEQVVTNLVCNAIKFSPMAGEVSVSINAARSGDDWQVQIEVCDSGLGIEDADLEMIFSPFVQLSQGEARCGQGVGLGLYIVRLISDAMGGTISVGRSEAGGASFVWRFTVASTLRWTLLLPLISFFSHMQHRFDRCTACCSRTWKPTVRWWSACCRAPAIASAPAMMATMRGK